MLLLISKCSLLQVKGKLCNKTNIGTKWFSQIPRSFLEISPYSRIFLRILNLSLGVFNALNKIFYQLEKRGKNLNEYAVSFL